MPGFPKGKKNLTPVETRSMVEKLNAGANPVKISEDYDITINQIRITMRKWKQYIKLKRKFNDS